MKSKTIFLILFFAVLDIVLTSCSIFKPNGNESTTLQVNATNTEVIVKDSLGNVVNNNGTITIGEDYTIILSENPDYRLIKFRINGTSVLNKLVNNQYTFTCTGATNIDIASAYYSNNDDSEDIVIPTESYAIKYSSCNGLIENPSNKGFSIDLVVYDSSYNHIETLSVNDSLLVVSGQSFIIEYYVSDSNRQIFNPVYNFEKSMISAKSFPIVIDNIAEDKSIHFLYNYSKVVGDSYSVEAGIPIRITTSLGADATELVIGEQYTIIDTCNPGYNAVVKVNNEQVTLPYTFIYAEDTEIEISADLITITPNVTAENCTYSFTDSNNETVTTLTYGETYTLSSTANENFTIQSATLNNESITLPYTFVAGEIVQVVISTAEIVPYTPEVTATNATYSFINANEEVVTELVQGTTYTLTAEPNQYYNLQETTFNGEVVTLPYTFTAGETAQVVISTVGMTVIPQVTSKLTSYHFEDLEGNTVTELTYGESYNLMFEPVLYYKWYLRDSSKQLATGSCYSAGFETYKFTCADTAIFNLQKGTGVPVTLTFVDDEGSDIGIYVSGWYQTQYKSSYTGSYGDEYTIFAKINTGYEKVSFTLNGVDFVGSKYTVSSVEEQVFVLTTEKITTSTMTITYTGLPTDYKISAEVVMRVSENEEDGYLKVGTADSSTGTTSNLSEFIGTYPYFVLLLSASDFESDITSQYTIKSAKLNGSSITFTADKEYKLYGYYTLIDFPTTENYTLEITFTAVSWFN